MPSASDISCIGDLDAACHTGIESLHQDVGLATRCLGSVNWPLQQSAGQGAIRMKVPLGGRNDSVARNPPPTDFSMVQQ
jgi:hypothetical protein